MKTVNIFWLVLAPFEHFIINFTKYYPFKDARAGYVCVFWLESSPLHWVNAESVSLSTESTRSETPHQPSQCGVRLHVNWVNAEDSNITEDFIIPRWLSWRWVSLRVDSVDVESHLALTQSTRNEIRRQLSHRRMLKNLNNSANSRTKSITFKLLLLYYYLAYKCSISAKNENKKISCKCTFKSFLRPGWSLLPSKLKAFFFYPN
jgi:hypothetical protein